MTDYFTLDRSSEREEKIGSLLGKGILEGKSMTRLRGVSFLGALNLAASVPEQMKFSRFDHSISVAYLTWLFCKNLGIQEEISLTATLAALIHDVTHPPFSHSTEIYLQIRSGVETVHTSGLNEKKIAIVIREGYSSLPNPLQKISIEALASRLYKILSFREERRKYHPYIADIFDTPFCPDTFDGVNRAWYALNTKDVKHRLEGSPTKFLEPTNPLALIRFISATTQYPFVYNSASPPSKNNLIYKFHDLMRVLYYGVIYSDWQSSAMVMFGRAVEIAYRDTKRFKASQDDDDVIKKIRSSSTSNKIYNLLVEGHRFNSLSKKDPYLYQWSLDYYSEAKKQNRTYKHIKRNIESTVASKLDISDHDAVFWHKFRPLVWSSENFKFKPFGKDEDRWRLTWESSEGKPSKEPEIEVYYTTSI